MSTSLTNSNQHVIFLGASRGVALYALLAFLRSGGHATLLLRNPSTLSSNADFLSLTEEERGRAKLVKGDAFVEEDVQAVVDAAGPEMDTVVFSIGGSPSYQFPLSFPLNPPQICARASTVLLRVLHRLSRPGLRLVMVSSMGIGEKHREVPWGLRWFYGSVLEEPHKDKAALEYLCLRAAANLPTPPAPDDSSLPPEAADLQEGWLPELVLLRPAFLTDGAERGADKIRKAPSLEGAWTISRRDVGLFIVEECLKPQEKWVGGEGVVVAY